MSCMDIIRKLNDSDRAECWKLFTELTRVFMLNRSEYNVSVDDLKESAFRLNKVFEKNGYNIYFDLNVEDSVFIETVLSEMQKIRNSPKIPD